MLRREGVPASVTISLTFGERIIVLAILATFAGIGATQLLQVIVPQFDQSHAETIRLLFAAAIGVLVAMLVGMPNTLRSIFDTIVTNFNTRYMILSFILSLLSSSLMVTAYILVIRSFSTDISLGDVFAASTIVMLSASLPLSASGWGVRELSAVVIFGLIGVNAGAALGSAILIGLLSLGALAISVVLVLLFTKRGKAVSNDVSSDDHLKSKSATSLFPLLATTVPIMTAACIYFQVRLPIGSTGLNINLADPFACLGGLLLAWQVFVIDHKVPAWRVPALPWLLAAMTVVLIFGFINGYAQFGLIGWALTNRLVGWAVLLAYLATGILAVTACGRDGIQAILRAFVAVAFIVCLVEIVTTLTVESGLFHGLLSIEPRLRSFSANPNAFGFIILLALSVVLSARHLIFRPEQTKIEIAVLTILLIGIGLSGSRAALGAFLALLLLLVFLRNLNYLSFFIAFILSICGANIIIYWNDILVYILGSSGGVKQGVMLLPFAPMSDHERWTSMVSGFDLWSTAPLFGAGLGSFIETFSRETGATLIIHNTALWLLAEVGLVGFAVFAGSFGWFAWWVRPALMCRGPAAMPPIAFVVLFAFAIVSLVHDMMFQRAIWLLLGVCLVLPRPSAAGVGRRQLEAV